MTPSTGGTAVVRALERCSAELVFGIPGSHNLEIYRALSDSPIRHVATRHEQGAGYAADGYARSTGRPGVVITTSGPGLTNATTAAATAHADSVPMLLISPGVPRGMERADVGWLHELKDQQAHLDAILTRSVRVADADGAIDAIVAAFDEWGRTRRRPVHVEVPLDVLDGPWEGQARAPDGAPPPLPAPADLDRAAEVLARARAPVIIGGGGCTRAACQLTRLAERWDAPTVTTVNGKGVLSEIHPLAVGSQIRLPSAQRLASEADVLLVVGSELADSDLWGGKIDPRGAVVRVDLDPGQLAKNLPAAAARDLVGLVGDAGAVLAELADRLTVATRGGAARAAQARADAEAEALERGAPWREVNDRLRSLLPGDVIVAGDSAQVSYFGTAHFWPLEEPGRFLYPTGYATLGYGLPAAIGAKLANPERTVIALVGDGGFTFTGFELLTAAREGLCLPIVVMDNSGFGEIRDEMVERGIPRMAVDLEPPDFALLAQACGGKGERLGGLEDLGAALERALGFPGPTVLALSA